jgi:mono/diheme cytochrome c family protein
MLQKSSGFLFLVIVVAVLAVSPPPFHHARATSGQTDTQRQDSSTYIVTPVEGPSWIRHLGIDLQSTALGQMGGEEPAPASQRKEPALGKAEEKGSLSATIDRILSLFRSGGRQTSGLMDEKFILTGEDLYRLNCQSCHGPGGVGLPPEIKSLLGPVEGTSPDLIQDRMKKLGRPIDEKLARELASSAEASIRQRLNQGGEKMPPFRHLRGDEVDALISYLKVLAGVSVSGQKAMLVTESVARVGEHVVKGTCHTCHDATGPGAGHMAMMTGVIPSLASFPEQNSMQEIVRQVQMGSSSMMGMMGGASMPPLPYITEKEVDAAYLYLVEYPPRP